MAVRARVRGAVLSIVAETMTLKAFSQWTSWSRLKHVRAREYSSGGRENASAIREMNVLSGIPRDWESPVVRVGQVIIRISRIHCGGRGRSRRWRRRG